MSIGLLYLFFALIPNIHAASSTLLITTSFIALMALISSAMVYQDSESVAKIGFKYTKVFVILSLISLMLNIISPSDTQLYKIAGGYVATNTKDIAKLPDNLVAAANSWLEAITVDKVIEPHTEKLVQTKDKK